MILLANNSPCERKKKSRQLLEYKIIQRVINIITMTIKMTDSSLTPLTVSYDYFHIVNSNLQRH